MDLPAAGFLLFCVFLGARVERFSRARGWRSATAENALIVIAFVPVDGDAVGAVADEGGGGGGGGVGLTMLGQMTSTTALTDVQGSSAVGPSVGLSIVPSTSSRLRTLVNKRRR